jgi:hypothetical protein
MGGFTLDEAMSEIDTMIMLYPNIISINSNWNFV